VISAVTRLVAAAARSDSSTGAILSDSLYLVDAGVIC
jgi:hypothetical protein